MVIVDKIFDSECRTFIDSANNARPGTPSTKMIHENLIF